MPVTCSKSNERAQDQGRKGWVRWEFVYCLLLVGAAFIKTFTFGWWDRDRPIWSIFIQFLYCFRFIFWLPSFKDIFTLPTTRFRIQNYRYFHSVYSVLNFPWNYRINMFLPAETSWNRPGVLMGKLQGHLGMGPARLAVAVGSGSIRFWSLDVKKTKLGW